jgi:uncharacterized protein (TIGR00369 family)
MMSATPPPEPGERPQPGERPEPGVPPQPAPRQARRPARPEEISRHNAAVPFNAWLGAEVLASDPSGVRVRFPWRAEFGGAPGMTHGGLLAGLIDATAFMTLMAHQGGAGPTVDMRVDYHRSTVNGPIYALGRITRAGATLCNIEIQVEDEYGRLIASGRCVYLSHARRRPPA